METYNYQRNNNLVLNVREAQMKSLKFDTYMDLGSKDIKQNITRVSHNAVLNAEEDQSHINGMRNVMKNIYKILDDHIKKSFILQGACGILIPCLATLYSLTVTAWPQHNVITNPEYWYEVMGPLVVGNYLVTVTAGLLDCTMIMKIEFIWSKKVFLKMFFVNTLGFVIPYISIHIVWVHVLGYPHPMPFIGQLCWLIGFISRGVQFWFLFPTNLRMDDKKFRKRILAYLSFYPLSVAMGLGYNQLTSVFVHVPLHFQWCLGLFIPVLKEFNTWWNTKIAFKAAGGNDVAAKVVMVIYVLSVHSLSLTFILPNVSNQTAFLLILFESIPSILTYFKLVKRHRQRCDTEISSEMDEALKCLVVEEYFELLIPFVYCTSFVLAYYGPNSDVLGNVRNDYWQYEKVENLAEKLGNVTSFAVIIAVKGLVFSLGLWIVCKINMLKVYCNVLYDYGTFILLYITATLNAVIIDTILFLKI